MSSIKVGKYSFDWTDRHLSAEETGPLRYEYDELGSNTVKILQAMQKLKDTALGEGPPSRFDMYAALQDHHSEHETLSKLWAEVNIVPPWVDWHQIERGQKFFYRYAVANLTGFALQGFVGENSAASGVVEVLVRTGGFSTSLLRRRLLETFQFLLQVTKDLNAIKPGGECHISAVRVRLLHGAVRERIMKLVEARPDYFNLEKFGVPINTLDSIHSISTFCCNHMWLQLPLMGVHPSQQEMADYIALFRYVGYLLATPDKYFASVAKAKATMESMLLHERELTDTSRVVGYNFVQCLTDMPPFNISADFIAAGSRALNCDEFCDLLGFNRPGILPYACFRGLCWFVRGLALAQQGCPCLDETVVDYSRKLLHRAIITSKSGLGRASKLDFKYVPQLGKLTGRENNDRPASASLFSRPVESFFFCIFLVIILSSLLVAGSIILLFVL